MAAVQAMEEEAMPAELVEEQEVVEERTAAATRSSSLF